MPRVRANGIEIAFESFGDVADPAILLIQGLNTPLTGWPDSLVAGLVERGFRVVRFDNRDVGRSSFFPELGAPDIAAMMTTLKDGGRPVAPYGLEAMADDAAGLIDALGVERAHLAGASMGGMIAQLVAIGHADKTKSLVSIMSTTGRPALPAGDPGAMRALVARPASASRSDRMMTAVAATKAISGSGFPQSEAELLAYLGRSIDYTRLDLATDFSASIVLRSSSTAPKTRSCRPRTARTPRGRSPARGCSSFPAWATTSRRR